MKENNENTEKKLNQIKCKIWQQTKTLNEHIN